MDQTDIATTRFFVKNIRKIVWAASAAIALLVFFFVEIAFKQTPGLIGVRLTEAYALIALVFLYISLLPSPFYAVFPDFPYKAIVIKSRRATGTSTFFFALLHAFAALQFELGGFSGLKFLNNEYLLGISYSFAALVILAVLTVTSFDFAVSALGKKWKWIHRLVYLAAILVVIHAFLLGSQFMNISEAIPQVFLIALLFLLLLESTRAAKFLHKKYRRFSLLSWNIAVFVLFVFCLFLIYK